MTTVNLTDETTAEIDIGNSKGLSASNVSAKDAKFYIDYFDRNAWCPVFGEITLKPNENRAWTRVEIGHDHVRVGARGEPDGTTIVKVTY